MFLIAYRFIWSYFSPPQHVIIATTAHLLIVCLTQSALLPCNYMFADSAFVWVLCKMCAQFSHYVLTGIGWIIWASPHPNDASVDSCCIHFARTHIYLYIQK